MKNKNKNKNKKPKNNKAAKKRSSWSKPTSLVFNGIGFPDRYSTHLRYTESVSLTGSSAPAAQVFRMNSCFDPDLTGTGTQPTYFDQLSTVYGIYCVIGALAYVEFINPSTTESFYTACVFSDQNISSLSVEALTETKYMKSNQVSYSPGPNRIKVSMPYMRTAQIMGQKEIESDANMYAGIGSNPNDQWFLIIKIAATDGVTSISGNIRVEILYHVIFKDLTSPGES